jgi:mannose-6-phosphate isomerase-like protein (cupin superfamily)
MHEIDERPWGIFEVLLDEAYCKVKRITVWPGQRLSLQHHENRSEVWVVVLGEGRAYLAGRKLLMSAGDSIRIPKLQKHRMSNDSSEPLVFIETQYGESFDEDDIVRHEDDYDRV